MNIYKLKLHIILCGVILFTKHLHSSDLYVTLSKTAISPVRKIEIAQVENKFFAYDTKEKRFIEGIFSSDQKHFVIALKNDYIIFETTNWQLVK